MLLKDKVAVITGGAGINGLGFATARQMAAQGARVAILDLARADPLAAAARIGADHLGIVADVTDKAGCEGAAAKVLEAFGRIDVLVNNAGITQPVKTLEITVADYDRILDVSLRGTLYMSQARASSDAAAAVGLDRVHFLGLGAAWRRHLRRVRIIRPRRPACWDSRARWRVSSAARASGELHHAGTHRNGHHAGKAHAERKKEISDPIPLARLGRPDDVAGACVFLASDLAAYCTGITLDVNGGMLIH
jgi:NAD(P)-dependent dehydrogenase (short-subunit alcohol dehydrogenase family)